MQTLRAIYKGISFVALLLVGFLVWVAGLSFIWWSAAQRWQWRCWVLRQWARANALLLGMNLHASGKPLAQPMLLLANHLSYLDVIVLAMRCDAVFVAKSEIAQWPLIGFLSRCMGTIFIERGRKRDILRVNALIENALRQGRSVILFPEGTTSDGTTVLPFKSPLLEPAVKLAVPVQTASLHYATLGDAPAASTAVCWWGDMEFVPHLWRLFQLDGFFASVNLHEERLAPADRKTLARAARTGIVACLPNQQVALHYRQQIIARQARTLAALRTQA